MKNELSVKDFPAFIRAVYGEKVEPFPWQERMLADVLDPDKGWPGIVALPTAAGKTSCLDIAVFAIAVLGKSAPRRIFFTVDRRVIVDEAYRKAEKLAAKLQEALNPKHDFSEHPILAKVANKLQELAGAFKEHTAPLKAYQLRGGVFRDNLWAEIPTQPLIVATTVDQLGSRLLFRGYGVSSRALPKHAALVGNDSLIILDEAHCSRPLEQTLRAVRSFSQIGSSEEKRGPVFVVMSATPSEDGSTDEVFKYKEKDFEHPILSQRYRASKMATLSVASGAKGKKWSPKLAEHLSKLAQDSLSTELPKKLAVMVNRVDTARRVFEILRKAKDVDVVLMTGRMRELDRNALLNEYEPFLKSGSKGVLERPLVVVATQCLEVGADFDFHVLISECASLDALRQRFGRLDRLGELKGQAVAHIVIREDQVSPKDADPVYGEALTKTWNWLGSIAENGQVDFSQEKMTDAISEDDLKELNAPSPDAPILMPAYLDCWTQTSPKPFPEPDVSLFLRGRDRSSPEVRVLWRDDLQDSITYTDILSLVPPTMCETVAVPLTHFRRWLAEIKTHDDDSSDVGESQVEEPLSRQAKILPERGPVFRWRGSDDSKLLTEVGQIQANDVIILQSGTPGSELLGDFFPSDIVWDRGDEAQFRARRKAVLRIPSPNPEFKALSALEEYLFPEFKDSKETPLEEAEVTEDLRNLLRNVQVSPDWEQTVRNHLADDSKVEVIPYTGRDSKRGWVFFSPKRLTLGNLFDTTLNNVTLETEDPSERLSLNGSQQPATLHDHCNSVGQVAGRFAELLDFPNEIADDLYLAGLLHDVGKSDPRFQAWLANGSRQLADSLELRAKSAGNLSKAARERAREMAGYPRGKRHEFVSAGIVAKCEEILALAHDPDLVLYLVATHHGMGRPFCEDLIESETNAQTRPFVVESVSLSGTVDQHMGRPNQGHSDRFWSLTEKYGWWELSYLESLLVCSDQLCSKDPGMKAEKRTLEVRSREARPSKSSSHEVLLDGIDGSNIIGFLCALGTLRTLSLTGIDAKLSWDERACWIPTLHLPVRMSADEISAHLDKQLKEAVWPAPIDHEDNTHKLPLSHYRAWARIATKQWLKDRTSISRAPLDWLCALAGEVEHDDFLIDTAFRTMSGAGHQHFLKTMRDLQELTEQSHIHAALFDFWDYRDGKPTLRFDPLDDRRYALRWNNPSTASKEPIRSMRGANRLAVEALPLYPTWPRQGHLETAGFRTKGAKGTYFYWPIWTEPMSLPSLRPLLWSRGWEEESPHLLSSLGISELFRAQRITIGKVRNFTPSQALSSTLGQPKAQPRSLLRV